MTRLGTDAVGRVYVVASNDDYTEIKVYAPRFAKRAPLRRLIVDDVGGSMAVSPTGEVAILKWDGDAIEVYGRNARGRATPIRVIKGPATGLVGPEQGHQLAVGPDGRVWASKISSSALVAFAPGARGNVAPAVRIDGPRTGLSPRGALPRVDAAGRVYALQQGRVSVFAPSANGDVAPLKVLNVPLPRTRRPGLSVGARGDMVTSIGKRSIGVWRTLFPTRPSKVRAVRVTGKGAAAKRTVRWKKPSYDGGRAVQKYRVVIRKGSKVLRAKSLKPGRRSYTVKRSALRRGKLTVTVRAKTSNGWSPKVVKRFRVR
ncbi:fibronectin type III domain-containing protein [Mumia sp. zg.B17]|uniref:fibronectin type III domain-containing protein n=1 Tax=Mumia sp. zg.B17 TaxID=2855446 RepID=UPI001C6EC378|nr:fibronectin type III domain-containing protein [Mumia sp. zg.B17]MBW9205390.1 fibronectin type III domain-containing protein [Mumia sp. zg.B17]